MRIGMLGNDAFMHRIIAAIAAEDRHTLFHSRYWNVFEETVRDGSFQLLIYHCPIGNCPFGRRRCVQLSTALRIPSVLLYPAHTTVRREISEQTLFHLAEVPFYPIDFLNLIRLLSKRTAHLDAAARNGDSPPLPSLPPLSASSMLPTGSGPLIERDVELAPHLRYDRAANAIVRRGLVIHLSRREARLLETLVEHENRIVTFDNLFHSIWPDDDRGSFDNLYVVIRSLKTKLGMRNGQDGELIQNIYGAGYRLQMPVIEGEECSAALREE